MGLLLAGLSWGFPPAGGGATAGRRQWRARRAATTGQGETMPGGREGGGGGVVGVVRGVKVSREGAQVLKKMDSLTPPR
jgi:hypothetical protein